jgi:hypothetical protein
VLFDKSNRIAIRPSANNRYLVDADGKPFLMVGDPPQNLIVRNLRLVLARLTTLLRLIPIAYDACSPSNARPNRLLNERPIII